MGKDHEPKPGASGEQRPVKRILPDLPFHDAVSQLNNASGGRSFTSREVAQHLGFSATARVYVLGFPGWKRY